MRVKESTIFDMREQSSIESVDVDMIEGLVSIRGGGAEHFFYIWLTKDQAVELANNIIARVGDKKKLEAA